MLLLATMFSDMWSVLMADDRVCGYAFGSGCPYSAGRSGSWHWCNLGKSHKQSRSNHRCMCGASTPHL